MKKTILVVLVFAGVFVCGAVVGGALTFRFRDSFVEGRGAGKFMGDQWRELGDKLELTPEQRKKVRPILKRFSEDQQATRKQSQLLFERLRDDLEAILTPEQQKKHKELRAQQWERERERRSKERDSKGGSPGKPDGSPSAPPKQWRDRERREGSSSEERSEPTAEPSGPRPEAPPPSPPPTP